MLAQKATNQARLADGTTHHWGSDFDRHVLHVAQGMQPMPNVRIEDMGHKMGCNGVDNGKLWFDGVAGDLPCSCCYRTFGSRTLLSCVMNCHPMCQPT